MKLDIVAVVYTSFLLFASAQGAQALVGNGDIACNPANYAQSVISVARLLETQTTRFVRLPAKPGC